MKELSLLSINAKSPIPVSLTRDGSFAFSCEEDEFVVGFVKDESFLDSGVYQFFILSKNNANTSGNRAVGKTVITIIEEFFAANDSAMLYICDTSDGRQAVRDRLFAMWFNSFDANLNFTLSRAKINVEGVDYFASLVISNNNPDYCRILEAFKHFINEIELKLT